MVNARSKIFKYKNTILKLIHSVSFACFDQCELSTIQRQQSVISCKFIVRSL